MYSAQKWFDNFYDRFIQIRQENKSFGVSIKRREYTKLMMKFFEDFGIQNGFVVTHERLTIDQFWKHKAEGTVALEHEISTRGFLKKELPNLMDISADLKVLITYVYDYQFPWEPDNISEEIEREINSKYIDRFNEFLLIVGTKTRRDEQDRSTFMQRGSDWFARRFYIGAVRKNILVPSSSRRARKAWQTRKTRNYV